jgi:DNA-binding winged helix-turn-helix (wHTH) protein/tetratricopeptide (TPR) repeat protein/TolB-like protein
VLRFAGFELDQQRAELRGADGETIRLRPKPFAMLHALAANSGRIVSKQELMEAVWPDVHVGEDSLFQCIREIRSALGDDERRLIKAVSGRGYWFAAEVTSGPAGLTVQTEPALAAEELAGQADPAARPEMTTGSAQRRPVLRRPVAAAVAGFCAVIGIAAAAPILAPDLIFGRKPPAIAVMPIVDASNDPQAALMAANVTDHLTDGLARIANIRVVTLRSDAISASPQRASAHPAPTEWVLTGELEKSERSWELRARLTGRATREVEWTTAVSVTLEGSDIQSQQSRLAAGLGHRLAGQINARLHAVTPTGSAKVVVEQATAAIKQATRERFAVAQAMLEKALVDNPENVELEVALAGLIMRGIQMEWHSPADRAAAESNARSMLERALRAKPNYLPVLEAYCRFLTATNHFADSLVTCARALTFDPWNGLLLFNLGMSQLRLGRFDDALATFKQADRYDTPEVSRWTWLIGAGWANLLIGRNDDAVPWLQRSIAITPASGRTHMLLAVAYQRLGLPNEAKAAMARGTELRPGSTAANVEPPTRNSGQAFLEQSRRIMATMVEIGLPER